MGKLARLPGPKLCTWQAVIYCPIKNTERPTQLHT